MYITAYESQMRILVSTVSGGALSYGAISIPTDVHEPYHTPTPYVARQKNVISVWPQSQKLYFQNCNLNQYNYITN